MLSARDPRDIEEVRRAANDVLLKTLGPEVYCRGLVEISNICSNDCLYCGIRRSNAEVRRYSLSVSEITAAARWCAGQGYGSLVLQSGERQDAAFIERIVTIIGRIKSDTRSESFPSGLGITLCVGEQSMETYKRFYDAGAHRYLLRIETSDKDLFARIHPPSQSFERRLDCLRALRKTGFQVGTGVMIGVPGQTVESLADDIEFFAREDMDMIGMGPFIPHHSTPLGHMPCPGADERLRLGLLMIAVTRLNMPDINIAATTALEALHRDGRKKGLLFGANVIMPLLTPADVRGDYLLYPGKPGLDESAQKTLKHLEERLVESGRTIAFNQWGDSLHALRRGRCLGLPGRNGLKQGVFSAP